VVNERTVSSINTLVGFCARRDVPALTREAHVDVPPEVRRAFTCLRETTDFATRAADAQWAG
jgi:hypothetical protein